MHHRVQTKSTRARDAQPARIRHMTVLGSNRNRGEGSSQLWKHLVRVGEVPNGVKNIPTPRPTRSCGPFNSSLEDLNPNEFYGMNILTTRSSVRVLVSTWSLYQSLLLFNIVIYSIADILVPPLLINKWHSHLYLVKDMGVNKWLSHASLQMAFTSIFTSFWKMEASSDIRTEKWTNR